MYSVNTILAVFKGVQYLKIHMSVDQYSQSKASIEANFIYTTVDGEYSQLGIKRKNCDKKIAVFEISTKIKGNVGIDRSQVYVFL